MGCGLSDGELFILHILYSKRNFKPEAGYNSEKLTKIYSKKYSQKFDKAIQELKQRGYIAQVRKTDIKFYIPHSSFKEVIVVLKIHGFTVIDGRDRSE